jgi:streptogramin lyase
MNDPVIERVAREDPARRQAPCGPMRADAMLARVLVTLEPPRPRTVVNDRRLRAVGRVAGPLFAVAVAVIVAGVIVALVGHRDQSAPVAARADTPVTLTPARAVHVGRGAKTLLAADGSLWVTDARRVIRLDPATGRVQAQISVPANSVGAQMTVGAGSIWATNVASSTVVRINPHTNQVTATIHLRAAGNGGGIAYFDERIEVSRDADGQRDGAVVSIDPRTNHVVGFGLRVGTGPGWLAAGLGALWVQNTSAPDAGVSKVIAGGGAPKLLTRLEGIPFIGLGSLWVTPDPLDHHSTSVERYDPVTGQVSAKVALPRATAIAFGHGRAWILSSARSRSSRTFQPIAGTATLTQVDPRTNQTVGVSTHLPQAQPTSLAIHGNDLWIATTNGLLLHFKLGHP